MSMAKAIDFELHMNVKKTMAFALLGNSTTFTEADLSSKK